MNYNPKLKMEREGLIFTNHYGEKFMVIEYRGATDIDVKFENGYIKNTTWDCIKKGKVITPYTKTVLGHGYLGEGPYQRVVDGKEFKVYRMWQGLLERVYSPLLHKRAPRYKDCTLSEEWHNYQLFCRDILEMCPTLMTDLEAKYELDKDLLYSGNKHYSKETCCFIPSELNCIITQANTIRGQYPVGVSYDVSKKCFRAQVSKKDKCHKYGHYKTPEEAFARYKIEKETYVQERAQYWKDKISPEAYEALLCWEVKIND